MQIQFFNDKWPTGVVTTFFKGFSATLVSQDVIELLESATSFVREKKEEGYEYQYSAVTFAFPRIELESPFTMTIHPLTHTTSNLLNRAKSKRYLVDRLTLVFGDGSKARMVRDKVFHSPPSIISAEIVARVFESAGIEDIEIARRVADELAKRFAVELL